MRRKLIQQSPTDQFPECRHLILSDDDDGLSNNVTMSLKICSYLYFSFVITSTIHMPLPKLPGFVNL